MNILIKNRAEIVEALTKLLMQFDKDRNEYQTDVYLYYDSEENTAELTTFINVGGNSWLNDDHHTIYSDKEHIDDDVWAWYVEISTIADVLEVTKDELLAEVLKSSDGYFEDISEIDYNEVKEYIIEKRSDYYEKLRAGYDEEIESMEHDYEEKAEKIISNFEDEMSEELYQIQN